MPAPSVFDVKLEYCVNNTHFQQLFTGLSTLRNTGLIRCSEKHIRCSENIQGSMPAHLRDYNASTFSVLMNGKYRLIYDTHDSWEIDSKKLDGCDFYFKRSCSMATYQSLGLDCSKILPLGLNYHVLPNKMNISYCRRHVNEKNNSFDLLRELAYRALTRWTRDPYRYFVPTEDRMSQEPAANSEPKVLFMARTWDPYDDGKRSKEKIEMRRAINEMRAICIRALKKEFGSRFFGGFSHSTHAKEKYPDLILPDEKTSSKGHYIARLREFQICIATTGLHGSIGWKMGEYVAFSKAIVSESLQYDVPGHFEAGKNYLEFSNPDQCIEHTVKLFGNKDLRLAMMNENREYYLDFLRPDRMILNTLTAAMSLATA